MFKAKFGLKYITYRPTATVSALLMFLDRTQSMKNNYQFYSSCLNRKIEYGYDFQYIQTIC